MSAKIGMCGLALVAVAGVVAAADWPQWRGPERDGFCLEKGLRTDWTQPPKKLWQVATPGEGYNGPAVTGELLYLTGSRGAGKARTGSLYALRVSDGALQWQYEYGPEWASSYEQARSTPTVANGRIYLVSGMGLVVCVNAKDGQKVWAVDILERFRGRNIQWGVAESPLLVGKKVICHPGGPDAAVAALDIATGETVWTSKGLGDASAYQSPALLTLNNRRQIVTQTAEHVVGLDPETGAVLWKHPHKNTYSVHPNTPVAVGPDLVVVSSGYGYGTECLRISEAGATRVWHVKEADNHFHGILLIDQRLFLTSSKGTLFCLDPQKGTVLSRLDGVGKASLLGIEGGLLAYSESGKVLMIKRDGATCQVGGSFPVDFGRQQHWSQPVVANGVLYVRHGEGLAAYDLRMK
jgi:outer membrane protein assembly factor BamB